MLLEAYRMLSCINGETERNLVSRSAALGFVLKNKWVTGSKKHPQSPPPRLSCVSSFGTAHTVVIQEVWCIDMGGSTHACQVILKLAPKLRQLVFWFIIKQAFCFLQRHCWKITGVLELCGRLISFQGIKSVYWTAHFLVQFCFSMIILGCQVYNTWNNEVYCCLISYLDKDILPLFS